MRTGHTGVLAVIVVLFGCGPEPADEIPADAAQRYAASICDAVDRCSCMDDGFEDASACAEAAEREFGRVRELPGMKFDRACFEDVLEYFGRVGCESQLEAEFESLPCLVFEGTRRAGEPCASLFVPRPGERITPGGGLAEPTCADGLACVEGVCGPAQPPTNVGDTCGLAKEVGCKSTDAAPIHCNTEGVCVPSSLFGEPCESPYACTDSGSYCAGLFEPGDVGTCEPKLQPGASCDPNEIESCSWDEHPYTYCGATQTCDRPWPGVCRRLLFGPDEADIRVWFGQ